MPRLSELADGLYRLIKLKEDHNPVFPSDETVVEIREGEIIINVSTGREVPVHVLGNSRVLYGPLNGPLDLRPTADLEKVPLLLRPEDGKP